MDGFDRWEGAIRDGLQAMHKRGDLRRSADPDRLATALLAAVQGGLVLSQVHHNINHSRRHWTPLSSTSPHSRPDVVLSPAGQSSIAEDLTGELSKPGAREETV